MRTLAEPAYWTQMWEKRALKYDSNEIPFKDLFDRYIPHKGDCFEVGCFPGGYLIYLSNRFDLRVYGIDSYEGVGNGFTEHLSRNGAKVGNIVEGDFFKLTHERQYDVVCSFGFIEHFLDYRSVLRKHVEMVKPGGLLIVTCPNFRRVQFLLHWLLDRENLRKHVLAAMDVAAWETTLLEGGMEVVERGYSETFLFWIESRLPWALCLAKPISKFANWCNRRVKWPNPFLSPFMFCVARKPVSNDGAVSDSGLS